MLASAQSFCTITVQILEFASWTKLELGMQLSCM